MGIKAIFKDYLKNISVLSFGSLTSASLNMILVPILAVLYGPQSFGIYGLFSGLVAVLSSLVGLKYDAAIVPQKSDQSAHEVVQLSLSLIMIFLVIAAVCMLFIPDIPFSVGKQIFSVKLLSLALFTACFLTCNNIMLALLNRSSSYRTISTLRIVQVVIVGMSSYFLASWGDLGLVYGYIFGLGAITVYCLGFVKWSHKITRSELVQVAQRNIKYPKFLVPTSFMDNISMHSPVLIITLLYDIELAGQFAFVWRLCVIPLTLIGAAVGAVFLREFSRSWAEKKDVLMLLKRTWGVLFFIGIVPICVIGVFGDELLVYFMGSAWSGSGQMLTIVAPLMLAMLIHSPTSGAFLVFGIQQYSLYFGFLVLITRPASILVGSFYGDFMLGMVLFVASEIVHMTIYQLIVFSKSRRSQVSKC